MHGRRVGGQHRQLGARAAVRGAARRAGSPGAGQRSPRASTGRHRPPTPQRLRGRRATTPGQLGEEPVDVLPRACRGAAPGGCSRASGRPSPPARGSARARSTCRPTPSRPRTRARRAPPAAPRPRRRGTRTSPRGGAGPPGRPTTSTSGTSARDARPDACRRAGDVRRRRRPRRRRPPASATAAASAAGTLTPPGNQRSSSSGQSGSAGRRARVTSTPSPPGRPSRRRPPRARPRRRRRRRARGSRPRRPAAGRPRRARGVVHRGDGLQRAHLAVRVLERARGRRPGAPSARRRTPCGVRPRPSPVDRRRSRRLAGEVARRSAPPRARRRPRRPSDPVRRRPRATDRTAPCSAAVCDGAQVDLLRAGADGRGDRLARAVEQHRARGDPRRAAGAGPPSPGRGPPGTPSRASGSSGARPAGVEDDPRGQWRASQAAPRAARRDRGRAGCSRGHRNAAEPRPGAGRPGIGGRATVGSGEGDAV